MPETCSKFVGGGIQSGDNLDRLEWTAQVFLHIAKAQSEATICRRFNQKSRSLGNSVHHTQCLPSCINTGDCASR